MPRNGLLNLYSNQKKKLCLNKQTKGYVINLNRSPERLRKFFSQTSANLFTRMLAVDKKLLELFDLEIFLILHCVKI